MSYTYHQAAKIIGCFPATVRRIADALGMRHHRGGSSPAFLSDEDVIRIWEAIETKRNVRTPDSTSADRTSEASADHAPTELSARPLVGERSDAPRVKHAESLSREGATPSRKCAKPVIIGGSEGEPDALSPHFSGSRGQAKFNGSDPVSDEDRTVTCNLTATDQSASRASADEESRDEIKADAIDPVPDYADSDEARDLRARIDARALRGLDVEIAARESELATMRRARAVLARDIESAASQDTP